MEVKYMNSIMEKVVENKNGMKIDKIVDYLNSKFEEDYPEEIGDEDENLTEEE